jgi:hypothetical protein
LGDTDFDEKIEELKKARRTNKKNIELDFAEGLIQRNGIRDPKYRISEEIYDNKLKTEDDSYRLAVEKVTLDKNRSIDVGSVPIAIKKDGEIIG